jgi:hypothetical protein
MKGQVAPVTVALESVTAAAKVLHAARCPGDCGMLPGATGMPVTACCEEPSDEEWETAQDMLEAAAPLILAPVYRWLVEDVGYPFDFTFGDKKPEWLDVTRLAEVWAAKDGETVEVYRDAILSETGWPDAGPLCDECGLIVCICAGGETDGDDT